MADTQLQTQVEEYSSKLREVKDEIKKGLIGQDPIIDSVLKCLVCNGNVLMEGVPGLAKTTLILLLTQTVRDCKFQRIQFTPDMLPTDITGVTVFEEKKGFYTVKGPIFANFVLGDEINRTPPKVQSAMLQAMQEKQVTIGRKTYNLPNPFFVLATQNPLEDKGVYPLPEAQVDRFLFKINVDYPAKSDEIYIIDQNITVKKIKDFELNRVISLDEILTLQEIVKTIHMSDEIGRYIVSMVKATRYPEDFDVKSGRYVQWGGSPRASIYLSLAARATALMNERIFVVPEDVRAIAPHVLRHRIILNYEGKAKGVVTDDIIKEIIKMVPVI
ncbi:MAG: ATPase [Candidatus Altiarchaeales archaeon ex4484_96]|nr:MAG: ATPase [Candidatus Altiarchaeales archaeon ex4484_96]